MELDGKFCNESYGGTVTPSFTWVAHGCPKRLHLYEANFLAGTTMLSPFQSALSHSVSKKVVRHNFQVAAAITSSRLKIKHQSRSPGNTLRSSVPALVKNSGVRYRYRLVRKLNVISYLRRRPALLKDPSLLDCYQYSSSRKTVLLSYQWNTLTLSYSPNPGLQNHFQLVKDMGIQRYLIHCKK